MLKLKLQYFGHLMQRADSFEKTLMLGKIEGRRRPVNSAGITLSIGSRLTIGKQATLTPEPVFLTTGYT